MRNLLFAAYAAVLAALSLLSAGAAIAAEPYPLRAQYPYAAIMSTEELDASFATVLVVDVRSAMEYDVVHINGARHLPISKATFVTDLEAVRGKSAPQTMVFYCNGHTCAKSYEAYRKAVAAGFGNVAVYDAGIFDWIMAHPDKATLMGKTPAVKEKVIPDAELQKRMLPFAAVRDKAREKNTMVIDIRDPFQRRVVPDLPKMRNIPLDHLLGLLQNKQLQDKHLIILDAVGKQVRWLQYFLENNGYTEYSFLAKGVNGIE